MTHSAAIYTVRVKNNIVCVHQSVQNVKQCVLAENECEPLQGSRLCAAAALTVRLCTRSTYRTLLQYARQRNWAEDECYTAVDNRTKSFRDKKLIRHLLRSKPNWLLQKIAENKKQTNNERMNF